MTKYGEYIDLLRGLVRIPSTSGNEAAAVSFLSDGLSSMGVEHSVMKGNIVVRNRHFRPGLKTLVLDAHVDTVPASSGYTRDPFDPGIDDNVVFGLGSNDDGGSVVSMIATFRHFYEMPLPFNLFLCLTREEEKSGPDGARWLYARDGGLFGSSEDFPYPDFAIAGEPTKMQAATSERGLLVLDGHARGVSGHAARNEGVNALYIALEDIEKLRSHKFARHSEAMGDVMLNVTQIEAGTAHNVVPDSCRFVVDIRPTEKYDNSEILEELQALCRSELSARNLLNRSSATAVGSPLQKAAEQLGIPTFSSPTTSDWMRMGCDTIKMGPGDSARSHKSDEYIQVSEIENAIDIYIDFINTLKDGYTLE